MICPGSASRNDGARGFADLKADLALTDCEHDDAGCETEFAMTAELDPSSWFDSPPTPCPGCEYDLRAQIAARIPRCPECGRGFDPTDKRTYQKESWLDALQTKSSPLRLCLLLLLRLILSTALTIALIAFGVSYIDLGLLVVALGCLFTYGRFESRREEESQTDYDGDDEGFDIRLSEVETRVNPNPSAWLDLHPTPCPECESDLRVQIMRRIPRCAECGREFNPDDSRTYIRKTWLAALRRNSSLLHPHPLPLLRLMVSAALIIVLFTSGAGYTNFGLLVVALGCLSIHDLLDLFAPRREED
jgi:ribosomal protein L37AE/L43A